MTSDPNNNALYVVDRQRNSVGIFRFHYNPARANSGQGS
jgi:hypothetical protein